MSENVRTKVVSVISKTLNINISEITEKTGVGDLPDWDSMGHVNIISAVEEHFDVMFDVEEAIDCETVEDIVEVISEKLGDGA